MTYVLHPKPMENYRNVSPINIVESGSMAVLWYKVSHALGHNRTKKRKLSRTKRVVLSDQLSERNI